MNYNYLLYFSVLAQTEHYTTAAARLGISQPALSSAIHNLENSLGGVKLFEKVGRNIRLTEEGRFYQQTVVMLVAVVTAAAALVVQFRSGAKRNEDCLSTYYNSREAGSRTDLWEKIKVRSAAGRFCHALRLKAEPFASCREP